MKICWFTENYPPDKGGMSRSCDRIVHNLRIHHEVHVFHFTNRIRAFTHHAEINGTYTALPLHHDTAHTLNILWVHIKENLIIKASTLFVSFGSHLCLKGVPMVASWLHKPYVLCLRGNDFDTAIFSQKRNDLLHAIENAAAIACVTKEKVDRIVAMELSEKVFFTPNSIKLNEWQALESDIVLSNNQKRDLNINGRLVIGLVGFLKEKKGIDFFIKVMKQSNFRDQFHIRIIGDIDSFLLAKMRKSNIDFSTVKPTSQTHLISNYMLCDAVAIPSIYDGMPNVLFEAAALEIPIIAAKAGGIPDVLNASNSFLFNVLSDPSLSSALISFKNSSRDVLKDKALILRQHIATNFTPQKEINNYLKIIQCID
ncbi:glycosyltransferase family 4 protein [Spongiivirga citrea]|uniref:Glycosyltransferase n=1 Tax=Spongiivirga citrea TaxID=1481457 RepID=A0A6M0CRK5_9FLAO|nr:glycosyltransferase family 4 protein [Spongiivirga citrea]NER16540.1 glycosyltransferase [Spongiivirga citrea]